MFAQAADKASRFGSSRSVVCATRGIAATSQPQAAYEAIRVLQDGGNAIDAAVTASILLGVLEPMQIGLGGDVTALVHHRASGELHALNATGRTARHISLEAIGKALGLDVSQIPPHSVHSVTVPGAVDGWLSLLERFGCIDRRRALSPAIKAAEDGFAVAPQTAATWAMGMSLLQRNPASTATWLPGGQAPDTGARFRNPAIARSLQMLSEGGREAFYRGPLASAIVNSAGELGGFLTMDDFAQHRSDWVQPLQTDYRGYTIAQLPPNTQGVAVLQAMAVLQRSDLGTCGFGAPDTLHLQIEAARAALLDAQDHIADADHLTVAECWFLESTRLDNIHARIVAGRGGSAPLERSGGDTAFVCVADDKGNFAAVMGSLFIPWASGITAGQTGILLQNRGHGFVLDPNHPNVVAPGKRPRHTILPAMLLERGNPLMAFGFVGGDMQVQAQLQFLCNLIDFGMTPQEALDAPRWRHEGHGRELAIEEPLLRNVASDMATRGHELIGSGGFFGGGQAVLRHPGYGSLQGASDGRRDGCALGY